MLGPEGPLFADGNLYYVGWISNTLSKWDGKKTTVLNSAPGCGHNGLALTKQRTFIIACTNDPGAILEVDMTGKQLRRWDVDDKENKFVGGINDVVVAANGGFYATVFGPYEGAPTAVIGKNPLPRARRTEIHAGSRRLELRERNRRLARPENPLRR